MTFPLDPLGSEPPLAPVDQLLAEVSLHLGHGVALRAGRQGWELHSADRGYLGAAGSIAAALAVGLQHERGHASGALGIPDEAPLPPRTSAPPLVAGTVCECRRPRHEGPRTDARTRPFGCRACGYRGERSAEIVVCVEVDSEPVLEWADPTRALCVSAGRCGRHLDCDRLAVPAGVLLVDALCRSGVTTTTHTLVGATDDAVPFVGWSDLYLQVPCGCRHEPGEVAPTLLAAMAGWVDGQAGRGAALAGVAVDRYGRAVGWSVRAVPRVPVRAALEALAGEGELWLYGAGLTLGDPGWRVRHRGVDLCEGWLLGDTVAAAAGLTSTAQR